MANSRVDNVIFVDTTAAFDGNFTIESIKYIGNTSGTAVMTTGTSGSGSPLWQESGASNLSADEVCIHAANGFHVALTNGAKIYIYLE